MVDNRIDKLSQLLVEYSVAVRKGDRVVINGNAAAEQLIKALYQRVLIAGGHPYVLASFPEMDEIFYRYASDEQIKFVPKPTELIYETYDVRIAILGESNTRSLASVDPAKTVMMQQSRTGLMQTFMRRSAAGELRWVVAPFPTRALAQEADMGLLEYEDFVYNACLPDVNDPVTYWRNFSQKQKKIVDW